MNKVYRPFLSLAVLFVVAVLSLPAAAQPSLASATQQPPKPLFSSPITSIQNLITGPAQSTPVPSGSAAPSILQPPTETPLIEEPQETFGTRALNLVINEAQEITSESDHVLVTFPALPQLTAWFDQQINDQRLKERWIAVGHDLLRVVLPAFIVALLLDILFLPLRKRLRHREPGSFERRLYTLLMILGLRLVPALVFIGVSLALLDQNDTQKFQRFVVLNLVYALALGRIVAAVIRSALSPTAASLRLFSATNEQATYAYRWLDTYSYLIIYGYFFIDVARGIRVPATVVSAFGNILSLVLVLMTLIVITQKRATVATLIRGPLSAAQSDLTLYQSLRLWFARRWHVLASAYLIIGFLISALGINNGFALMLRGTILTLAIIVMMRLIFHAIDRWGQRDSNAATAIHRSILRFMLRIGTWGSGIVGICAAWGFDVHAFFTTPLGQRLLGGSFAIGVTFTVIALIYEFFNSMIEQQLNRRDEEGKVMQASARMRTLLPMVRNTVFILFTLIITLVVLSEIGFNIGPLLAGAGILGVAIGFGSQSLVKDFLTGLFIVIENTIAIGDVVQIGQHKGVVDAMSIRTLRLRDADGALHILPFSEVTSIINMTKDYSYAVVDVGVAYHSDLDHVMRVIRSVGEELQNDAIFKRVILEPVEVLGVETLGEFSITVRSRMRTRPGKQWDVRRMFLLRLKQSFDKENIEIPFPTVTQITHS